MTAIGQNQIPIEEGNQFARSIKEAKE